MYLITHTITSIIKTVSTFLIINFVCLIIFACHDMDFISQLKKKRKKATDTQHVNPPMLIDLSDVYVFLPKRIVCDT